jgi:hypothetical protein
MRRKKSFDEEAANRGAEAERSAAESVNPPGTYDLSRRVSRPLVAREAAALPLNLDATHSDGYSALVDRVIGQLRHLLYSLDEQRQDIVRFRDTTRTALARLGAR